jgi:UDP-N-acetylmuramyl pentapeptide phosphotransferase/UDP-N-acetylglucosamine-1-phosphate transferase
VTGALFGLPALTAVLSAGIIGLFWIVHTRVRGVFPDDLPRTSGRKAHGRPIGMAGLVPACATVLLCTVLEDFGLALAVAIAAAIGFLDDRGKARPIDPDHPDDGAFPWWCKGLGLLVAAVVAAGTSTGFDPFDADHSSPGGLWPMVFAVCFVFVVANAVNFLDNMDGVASSVGGGGLWIAAVILPSSAAALPAGPDAPSVPIEFLAGIWLGFLPWNWPRARLFLGDAGAYALGITLGATALRAATYGPHDPSLGLAASTGFALLLPALVPLIDFCQVVTCRLILGVAPWIGDRRHVSHLLHIQGHVPRPYVAPILAAATVGIPLLILGLLSLGASPRSS